MPNRPPTKAEGDQPANTERVLQEITAVSRRIEGMDASISSLTLETKSIRTHIANFHSRVMGLEHRLGTLETHMFTIQDRDQDLSYLRSKVTGLEDRSRRDNIRLLGIPKNKRVQTPSPIIACLLRHTQTRQLLQAARAHGPFRVNKYDVRITADYSKDTNERRKAFLTLRLRLRQLEMKHGLFDPARMWVTKNGVSRDFYNPEDLRLFLDSFQTQTKDPATLNRSQDTMEDDGHIPSSGLEKGNTDRYGPDNCPRGRDLERLTRAHDDRGQVVHAVAAHTQLSERDKSRSPLKLTLAPPELLFCLRVNRGDSPRQR
ncbi:hypothetical protein NDU88_008123 [Pleurodeles waltl]|uniref:Uncharacterized protein n=1 Tax=Pleurodeles waltl TaxID=8319 RepID=A0AAV7N892_PLEWA|nr:hypothetical protein NDU88_008123 [Pleurodeles waltl]